MIEDNMKESASRLMPIGSHLKELRGGLIRSFLALLVSSILSFYFSDPILFWLKKPLPATLVFLSPAEVLLTDIKLSLFFGFALSLPVVLYEFWRFVSPGLLTKEKPSCLPFIILSSLSFYLGVAFSYVLALPFALKFLVSYGVRKSILPQISLSMYVDFHLKFLFSFGLIFELPVVMVLLSKTGLLTTPFLVHTRKYAIIAAFLIAAILTPTPDILNQTLMAIPLILLYEIGILGVRFLGRSQAKPEEERSNPL